MVKITRKSSLYFTLLHQYQAHPRTGPQVVKNHSMTGAEHSIAPGTGLKTERAQAFQSLRPPLHDGR
ncbi:MAG: hypothetical protein V4726_18910 [Verrucomicrobiota bacterium]